MKRFDLKSLALGLIIGVIAIVGVNTVFAAGKIKSAEYSDVKVNFYGTEVPLKSALVAIQKDGSDDMQLYMPLREVLEYMQFNVDWNAKNRSVNITMKSNQ